ADPAPGWWREIFHFIEPDILLPSVMLAWLNLSLPAITNFSVLYARELGILQFGAFFVAIGATSLLGRPLLGRLSDRIGRDLSVGAGFLLQCAGLALIVWASDLWGMIACGTLYMLGNAIGSSTALALAVERAHPERRGKQMATFSVAYPLSYGMGSMIIGGAVEAVGYAGMFYIMAAVELAGFIFAALKSADLR
ncbi:MAG TPA: MFS transporter, partial [Candidatus Binatia bacterium]|nr:MFS transporter [Candidatus Binatia bacterium]